MKSHDKNKESSFLNYWNVNNLYVRFLKIVLKGAKNTCQFNADFMEN